MKHLWGKAAFDLSVSLGSLLDQAVYHLRDACLVCKVKWSHTFAISSGYTSSSFQEKSENIRRIALCSKV